MDRLTSLTVFVRVVDSGGFTAAGRRLNMSTTMVSSHVQALEDRLGARLLNRTTRKVSLTEIGKVYYERATQILSDLDEADQIASALQSLVRGTLRLHASAHVMRLLGPVVAEYLATYPDVSVELGMGERMVDLVEEGVDLAIRTTLPPDSSLIVRRLVSWRFVLCCAPAYLAAREPPREPAQLVRHNCLRYSYYPFEDGWHFDAPDGRAVVVRVSGNLISASAETLRITALAGQGIFLAPGFIVGDDLTTGDLVPIMNEYRPVEMTMSAVYPHRHHLSAKVRGFIDLLAKRIAENMHWMKPGM